MIRAMILRLLTLLCMFLSYSAVASPAEEETALRALVTRWEQAWTSHDARVMGALFTEDADFVNVAGLHWSGRSQIVSQHAERFATNLKNSEWVTRNVGIQLISSRLALLHIDWGISGDTDFDGTPRAPREGIMSWWVMKQDHEWLIRSAHNTNKSPRK